jgi:hypothetical protein
VHKNSAEFLAFIQIQKILVGWIHGRVLNEKLLPGSLYPSVKTRRKRRIYESRVNDTEIERFILHRQCGREKGSKKSTHQAEINSVLTLFGTE